MKGRSFANQTQRSHDEVRWLCGVHAVGEWVRFQPASLRVVYWVESPPPQARVREILDRARAAGIRLESTSAMRLAELTGERRHQGLAARCEPFPYASLEDVLALNSDLLVAIDQLQDPHNLGAIVRSCGAVGARAVILPKDSTVGVTPTVESAAAGATAAVKICRVTNLARTLRELKQHDYWVAAMAAREATNLYSAKLPPRLVLVIGGEQGLRRLVLENCDMRLSIPMLGGIESLNASVATAVALFEFRRRYPAT